MNELKDDDIPRYKHQIRSLKNKQLKNNGVTDKLWEWDGDKLNLIELKNDRGHDSSSNYTSVANTEEKPRKREIQLEIELIDDSYLGILEKRQMKDQEVIWFDMTNLAD